MTRPTAIPNLSIADWIALASRLILGGLFIYMGLSKALYPVEFLKLVRQYELVQNHLLLNSVAALLPWFEVVCGGFLVAGVGVRGSALVMFGMLLPFTLAVIRRAWQIHALQSIPFCAVKFDCGCGMGEVFICNKVLENSALMLLALWLLLKPRSRFCLRFCL